MVKNSQNPRELVAAVLAALEDGAWSTVAAHVSPTAAAAFRDEELQKARHQEALSQSDFTEAGLPAPIAEWFQSRRSGLSLLERVYAVTTASEFEQLSAPTVVERFLRAKHAPRPQGSGRERRLVVGAIAESDDLAHVVFRRPTWRPRQARESSVDVLTVRRTDEGWRCELNGGLVYDSSGGYSMAFYDGETPGSGQPAA
jgi:hypothetical protein